MAFTVISAFMLVTAATLLHMPHVTSNEHHQHQHRHQHRHNQQQSASQPQQPPPTPQPACSEPDDLHEQWDRLHTPQAMGEMHETFYLVPFLHQTAANQSRQYKFDLGHMNRTTVFSGSPECPLEEDKDYLEGGNPCPVYYTLNTDRLRYPHVLLEAQCKRCIRCQGISVRRIGSGGERRVMVPRCEGEYYHVRVLRRLADCVDHVYQYAQVWEKVQIGCSCRLRPRD